MSAPGLSIDEHAKRLKLYHQGLKDPGDCSAMRCDEGRHFLLAKNT